MTKKIAVFPGSFDPFTKGHEDIVRRALPLFDELYIAFGRNVAKERLFDVTAQMQSVARVFADEPKVKVIEYQGLTCDFCHNIGAQYIVRGLRNTMDFQYESEMAAINKELAPDIETLFILTDPRWAHLSSSTVRELYKHCGPYQNFLPSNECEK